MISHRFGNWALRRWLILGSECAGASIVFIGNFIICLVGILRVIVFVAGHYDYVALIQKLAAVVGALVRYWCVRRFLPAVRVEPHIARLESILAFAIRQRRVLVRQ